MLPTLATVTFDRGRTGRATRLLVLALCLAAAVVVLLRPASAAASTGQLSIMQDDDQLIYRGNTVRDQTLQHMKNLGVDAVRVTVLWRNVANGALKTAARRKRFKGDDPKSYPKANWDPYDGLVQACRTLGIGVLFNVTGPGPPQFMGHTRDKKIKASYKPNAKQFYKFVEALGKRYGGLYRDEDNERAILPRVGLWSIWNEPNQPAWLAPQYAYSSTLRRTIPYAPILYRELFLRGRQALANTSHGKDAIFAGETAPLGSPLTTAHSPMRPARFVRELFCMNGSGHRYTGRSALARRCSLFKHFKAVGGFGFTAWAHHAYTKTLAPNKPDRNRDSITLANIKSLERLLDRAASVTHVIKKGLPVAITEFGYETKPPDPFSGIPLATQAARINQADQIAYRDPRILSVAQFLYRDQPPVKGKRKGSKAYWFNYQSGLVYANGQFKPSATAYAMPFNITPSAGGLDAWGQLRFLPPVTSPVRVYLEFRPAGSPTWQVATSIVTTNVAGFYENKAVPLRGAGSWKAVWVNSGGTVSFSSREVLVSQ